MNGAIDGHHGEDRRHCVLTEADAEAIAQHVTDFASEMRRMVDRHEDKLSAMATVPGALVEISNRLADTERRMSSMHADNERRLVSMDERLKQNTDVTQQIRDAQIAGRILGKLFTWIGGIAAALGAFYAFIYQLVHNGKLPP
jgi:hypothetical protein